MRKKIIIFTLIFTFILSQTSVFSYAISASSAVTMVSCTGELLYEKDAHRKMSMASTTKIMTALLACESERLDEEVTVTEKMIRVEGTSMGLRSGDKLTLFNIVKGMMLLSGNDAANAVAIFLSGSLEGFAEKMNKKASELKMTNTHFVTPSGLDDDEHYSTAYDMALLASYAMKNEHFRQCVGEYNGKVEYINPSCVYTYRNHNRFLTMYDGACGVKTGFTKKSGRCLVTAVAKDGCYIIAVTLNAPDDWNDHISLYNMCLPMIKSEKLNDKFNSEINVSGGEKNCVRASVHGDIITHTAKNKIRTQLLTEKIIYAPVKKGDTLGFVRVYADEKLLGEYLLSADGTVEIKEIDPEEKGLEYRIKNLFRRFKRWLITAL